MAFGHIPPLPDWAIVEETDSKQELKESLWNKYCHSFPATTERRKVMMVEITMDVLDEFLGESERNKRREFHRLEPLDY